jgi:hypothetical protein
MLACAAHVNAAINSTFNSPQFPLFRAAPQRV